MKPNVTITTFAATAIVVATLIASCGGDNNPTPQPTPTQVTVRYR